MELDLKIKTLLDVDNTIYRYTTFDNAIRRLLINKVEIKIENGNPVILYHFMSGDCSLNEKWINMSSDECIQAANAFYFAYLDDAIKCAGWI